MLFDWFTALAQLVNFLILLFLLKKFLYGPITRAMRKRRESVAEKWKEAEESKRKADQLQEDLEAEQEKLEKRKKELEAEVREETKQMREKAKQDVARETEELRKEQRQRLVDERDEFLKKLRTGASQQIFSILRKTLHDLADADLEQQTARAFAAKLKAMDANLDPGEDPITVRSGFELDQASKSALTKALREALGKEVEVDYKSSQQTGFGLYVSAGGTKIEWSVDKYLSRMEEQLGAAFSSLQSEKEKNNDEEQTS